MELTESIAACRLCAERFAQTRTRHAPRPVVWIDPAARLLVAGQAPGMRVHESGIPFRDRSGDRLRDWLGLDEATFYDRRRVAILPNSFCFPGYDDKGSDLPPPAICAATWHDRAMAMMPALRLKLLIGAYSQRWYLGTRRSVTEVVRDWRSAPEDVICLPHPSWRNTGWLKRNPWFETELVPELRRRVGQVLVA
ncbi:uracil-DNA glycosylase family protein [Roseisalinus antarcticus]|uniref:Uracil DNA glycosylase superfamily protein n=1 Tax=Roseisalinus antarcticus TaxID=254357 RepID=A0A1Y5U040_9RHOB|nr:uracil-DNA glycosylase family protein [Roseisalinus antarcticus]SLN75743.1 Uracil DNA glycosylase superfamily protein [Roseisalinus antarcticus]